LSISAPTAIVNNFAGLLILRFFQGFSGSPALANGGASFGDYYPSVYVPYQLSCWVFFAWTAPALGPLIAGFAIPAKNWHWSMWEIVWMAGPLLVILLLFLPETFGPTIPLHRAQRLRKLTGDARFVSQSEIDQANLTARNVAFFALVKPLEIMIKDPAIFFVNLYTAMFYGIYYIFFEVFPLVFPPMHGFNLGETGLAFLSCQVGAAIGIVIYCCDLYFYGAR